MYKLLRGHLKFIPPTLEGDSCGEVKQLASCLCLPPLSLACPPCSLGTHFPLCLCSSSPSLCSHLLPPSFALFPF